MRSSDAHSTASAEADRPRLPAGAPLARLLAPAERVSAICETDRPIVLIGSRRDCDLPIGQSDISQVHCAVVNTGRSLIVVDLCSRSGTFINGERISAKPLRPDDVLRVSDVVVAVELLSPLADYSQGLQADEAARSELTIHRAGHAVALRPPALIGRRSGCPVVIDTPDVSLAHALVFCLDGAPLIVDLGSRSGTFVNGVRQSTVWLQNGDQISIGGESLRVERPQPEPTVVAQQAVAMAAAAPPVRAEAHAPAAGNSATPLAAAGGAGIAAAAALRMEGVGDIADLEVILQGLHAQISAVRSAADTREAGLQQRESQLTELEHSVSQKAEALSQREAQLSVRELALAGEQAAAEQRAARVQQAESQLAARNAELQSEKAALLTQLQSLDSLRAELATREQALHAAASEHERVRRELDTERATLQAVADEQARARARVTRFAASMRRRSVRQRASAGALLAHQCALESSQTALAARDTELAGREADLAARETDLAEREAAFAQVSSQVTRFRELLEQTNRLLCDGAMSEALPTTQVEAGAGAPPAPATPPSVPEPAGSEASAGSNGTSEFPAPLVRSPIFTVPTRPAGARSPRGVRRPQA